MTSGPATKILAVIPARFASERFPGKVIATLAGKPLVMHVYERTQCASLVSETIIATDDQRVVEALAPYNPTIVMTRTDHLNGTDRIAEVAEASDADIIVNVQGDEVLIDPSAIDAAVQILLDRPDAVMSTVRHPITDARDVADPNVVKVVCDATGKALYFSRSPIPAVREGGNSVGCHWQHVGLYAFRREFLLEYARMAPTPLEELEKLEQLRAIENGYAIVVADTEYTSVSVDTPEDLERVKKIIEAQGARQTK